MNRKHRILVILTITIGFISSCTTIQDFNRLIGKNSDKIFKECSGEYYYLYEVNNNLNSLVLIKEWEFDPQIILLDRDNCNETIIEVPSLDFEPHISLGPNGRYIAYTTPSTFHEFGVYDRKLEQFLVHLEGYYFAISPDGNCVAYWQKLVLKMFCWDSRSETNIFELPASTDENIHIDPKVVRWNSGGEYISFELNIHENTPNGWDTIDQSIALVEIATGKYQKLYTAEFIGDIDWSPDGRFLLFSVRTMEVEKIIALDPINNCVVFSINRPYAYDIFWLPDGDVILYSNVDDRVLNIEETLGVSYSDLKCSGE